MKLICIINKQIISSWISQPWTKKKNAYSRWSGGVWRQWFWIGKKGSDLIPTLQNPTNLPFFVWNVHNLGLALETNPLEKLRMITYLSCTISIFSRCHNIWSIQHLSLTNKPTDASQIISACCKHLQEKSMNHISVWGGYKSNASYDLCSSQREKQLCKYTSKTLYADICFKVFVVLF